MAVIGPRDLSERETFAYIYASWKALLAVSGRVQHEFQNDTILMFIDNFWSYSTDDIFGGPITRYGIGDRSHPCVESDLGVSESLIISTSEVLFNRAVWRLVRFIGYGIAGSPLGCFDERGFISELYESLFAATKDREARAWIKNIYMEALEEALEEALDE